MKLAKEKRVNMITVKKGDKLVFDNSCFAEILYPIEPLPHDDINNNSIVAKIKCQGINILFTRRC